jgi:hypothetical protein
MRSNGLACGIWRARSQRETTQFPFRRSLNSVFKDAMLGVARLWTSNVVNATTM